MTLLKKREDVNISVGVARDEDAPVSVFQRFMERIGTFWTFGVLILMVLIFGFVAPEIYTKAAWLATSSYGVEYLILAVGQTFVILTGGIDLADGATLGFSGMAGSLVMSNLLNHHSSGTVAMTLGIVVMLVVGTFIGFVNGFIITKMKIPPFIVTLGMLTAITGGTDLLNNGAEVTNLPGAMSTLGTATIISGWVPIPVLIAGLAALIGGVVLVRTRFGMRTYSVGSNEIAARRSGINVDWHLIRVYMISGFLSGLAALMVTANFTAAAPIAGTNDELYAIASVIIGGASIFGGRGTMFGTVIGTAIIATLTTGLVLANVAPFWQQVAIGAIIVAAVAIDRVRVKVGTD
ncbi:MAG: ABC transporter permease [Acidimicrobiaceae bacterium]|nr:ABC transporter permease [Acidimicrobiaceae bacterium]